MEKMILQNQVGYQASARKIAVVRTDRNASFRVMSGTKVMLTGRLQGPKKIEKAGETVYTADFSALTTEGDYLLEVDGVEEKAEICINDKVFDQLEYQLLRFFYMQRCGCTLTEQYAGKYAHPDCHHTIARIYGTDETREVSGGWHDAGDYGRYVDPAAVTIAELILARKMNRSEMEICLDIPESKGSMPDLLSEIKYELDWMLKMQNPSTGEVYHKVTCASFPGFVMPEEETEELVISPVSVTATATFAAVMAMCSHEYEDYNETFSKNIMQAAKRAYAAMKKMDLPGGYKNPEGIVTGAYDDPDDTDERYWAAAALYQATGMKEYRDDFEAMAKEKIHHGYGWENVGTFGNIAYLMTKFDKDAALAESIRTAMLELADTYYEEVENDSFGLGCDDYKWGSNYYAAQTGNHLYDAYILTKDEKYLKAAAKIVDYLLGTNPTGYCYVTGFGSKSPIHPHHRPSEARKAAMPGMLVGGPDEGLHDPDAVEYCTGKPGAKCYVDVLGSYSTNEVTIYWNAAFIRLLVSI